MVQDLRVQFSGVEQTPGTLPNEEGLVQITVTNYGNQNLTNGVVNIYGSINNELNLDVLNSNSDHLTGTEVNSLQGTDELLGTLDGINLAANESHSFTIDFASPEFRNPSVVSPGAYYLFAEIDPENTVSEVNGDNNQDSQFISVAGTDAILDWNSVFLNAVQTKGELDRANGVQLTDNSVPGEPPPIEARNAAILSLAQYEAVSTITNGDRDSTDSLIPPPGASAEAAAVGAGYQVLSVLYPEQKATFDLQIQESLAEIDGSQASKVQGFGYGIQVANQILAQREDDGSDTAHTSYTPGTAPGNYNETHEGGSVSAVLPNFGDVTPFVIDDVANFRPDGPPKYGSEQFIQETEELRLYGGRGDTATTEILRTPEQTEIAEFWAYDRLDTFRPPGQWIEIAQEVALDQGNTLEENALLFAGLNTALADAGIVAWNTKYTFDQQRPFNTIVQDELTGVTHDPDWRPLLSTPPFPDYVSGHATFGGAAAAVLEDFFGEDISFEIASQELPGVTRTFDGIGELSSFEQAALENANSRLYAGVHLESSNLDGLAAGQLVGEYVSENFFA